MTIVFAVAAITGLGVLCWIAIWADERDIQQAHAERVRPPEGAIVPAKPTYNSDNGELVGVWHPRSTEKQGRTS